MKLSRHIPNFITTLNLLSGSIAVVLSFNGEEITALYLIIIAALFDFLDGFAARILKAYSPMGKELDSLADLISFGMAPAVLLINRYSAPAPWLYIPLILVLFSALRLAKFNTDTRQSKDFIGMPTPAAAILVVGYIHFTNHTPSFYDLEATLWFLPLVSTLISLLLVSNIKMFSLKITNTKWSNNRLVFSFVIYSALLAIVSAILEYTWSLWILIVLLSYILYNIVSHIASQWVTK